MSPAITAPTLWNYDVCVQFPGVVGEGATVLVVCTAAMPPRRYLIVQIARFTYINFCEIEVYAPGKPIFVLSYSQSNIKTGQQDPNVGNSRVAISSTEVRCQRQFRALPVSVCAWLPMSDVY